MIKQEKLKDFYTITGIFDEYEKMKRPIVKIRKRHRG